MSDQKIEPNSEEPIVFKKGVNRRDFLKVSGATAGAAAVVGATGRPVLRTLEEVADQKIAAESNDEQVFFNVCRVACQQQCPMNVHVRNGRVVKTSLYSLPDARYNRICLRGLTHPQYIYNPDRIKYPMKRVGARGEDKWERISWDEAIQTIADKFTELQKQYGRQALAFLMGGPPNMSVHSIILAHLEKLLGATYINQSADVASSTCMIRVLGDARINEAADMANARTIFIWGTSMADTYIHSWHFVADAMENGAKLVVVDPRLSVTASKADIHVRPRPASDTALVLSMIQVIIEDGLFDQDFVLQHTVAPFLVREDTKKFLRMSDLGVEPIEGPKDAAGNPTKIDPAAVWDSDINTAVAVDQVAKPALEGSFEVNGIKVNTAFTLLKELVAEYTPELAQKITDVDPEMTREIARLYATNTPSTIYTGYAPGRYVNGGDSSQAMAIMTALTKNLGVKGAGLGVHYAGYRGLNTASLKVPEDAAPVVTISVVNFNDVLQSGTFKGQPYPIKALWVAGANALSGYADQNGWINQILPALDLVVVADRMFNDSARYADIVLPVPHHFEVSDLIQTGGGHVHVMLAEAAITPAFEAKPDFEIYRLLASKMGLEKYIPKTADEFIAGLLDSDQARDAGITLERLHQEKAIRFLPKDNLIHAGYKFYTASGRIEIYSEKPSARLDYGQDYVTDYPHLPKWRPPAEAWPDNPLAQKYPLTCFQEKNRFRVHTEYYNIPWLRELDPEPLIKLNPSDAQERGIQNGDIVEAFNDRGHAVAKVVLTEELKPGMVNVVKGWQQNQYIAGGYAELSAWHKDPFTQECVFYDCLVEVRKWKGA